MATWPKLLSDNTPPAGESAPLDSKSARKRAHRAIQDLGETLIELTPGLLERIPLQRTVRDAVEFGRGLRKGARKRHLRHLANLLASEDLDAVHDALDRATGASRAETARLHRVERWRDRLLEEGDEALGDLVADYPQADRQKLRQFVRAVRRERERGAPPRQFRELLRYLRVLDEASD